MRLHSAARRAYRRAGRLLGRPGSRTRRKIGLRSHEPASRLFGLDRGRPIDRFYIERFLERNSADIRGRVLEVAEPTYTEWFGSGVERSDVLHIKPGEPKATIVGDLVTGEGIPDEAFDCLILTQTFHVIYEVQAAIEGAHRALKPGGVLLATLPGISQISRVDMDSWGDYWRFTTASARRLFGEAFEHVEVEAHGNVLAASAFLYGLAWDELEPEEMELRQPDYELLITVRAKK
jgi:hypothetical protein